jgi:predicted secreted protein
MAITSIAAIYLLFFVMTAFVMLPFGVRTADEAGVEKVPGQADSAPVDFRPGRLAARAAGIAALVTALYVLNYEYGWITLADIDVLPKPPKDLQAGQPGGHPA